MREIKNTVARRLREMNGSAARRRLPPSAALPIVWRSVPRPAWRNLVDATDLKSVGPKGRPGSSPGAGTTIPSCAFRGIPGSSITHCDKVYNCLNPSVRFPTVPQSNRGETWGKHESAHGREGAGAQEARHVPGRPDALSERGTGGLQELDPANRDSRKTPRHRPGRIRARRSGRGPRQGLREPATGPGRRRPSRGEAQGQEADIPRSSPADVRGEPATVAQRNSCRKLAAANGAPRLRAARRYVGGQDRSRRRACRPDFAVDGEARNRPQAPAAHTRDSPLVRGARVHRGEPRRRSARGAGASPGVGGRLWTGVPVAAEARPAAVGHVAHEVSQYDRPGRKDCRSRLPVQLQRLVRRDRQAARARRGRAGAQRRRGRGGVFPF